MSLLLEALKRAEANKLDAGKQPPGRSPIPSDNSLSLEPISHDTALSGDKSLPDLASHLEHVDADLADIGLLDPPPQAPIQASPAAAAPPHGARPEKPEQRDREAIRNAFSVKQATAPPARKSLWLMLGSLGIATVAIGGYVFYTLQGMNRGSLAAAPRANPSPVQIQVTTPTPAPPPATSAGADLPALPVLPTPNFSANSGLTAADRESTGLPPLAAPRPARLPLPEADPAPAIRLAKTPPEADSTLTRGHAALQQGDLELARRDYEQSLRRDPNNTDTLLALAAIAHRQGRIADAETFQQRALIANPNDAAAQAAVLGGAATAADPQTAESRLKGLLGNHPESAPLNFALGNLYARQKRWSEAQQAYFNAVAADADNPDYLFNLAVSLDQLRQPRPAGQHYRLAMEAASHRPAAFDRDQVRKRLSELQATAP